MKHILDSLDLTSSLTARKLTAGIRRTAVRSGWNSEVARNLSVGYSDGKFEVKVPEEYQDAVMTLEYGNESVRPTSVIRKFKYSNAESTEFLSNLNKVGKKK
jgi:hypothetical protein